MSAARLGHPILALLGEGDCERLRDGLLAQPANAWTSVAFLLVGGWLLVRGAGLPPAQRSRVRLLAVAVAAVGVGSIAFHGPQQPGAEWLHDVTIAGLLVVVVVLGLGDLRRWTRRRTVSTGLSALAVPGLALAVAPAGTTAATGILAAVALAAEVTVHRAALRPAVPTRRRAYVTGGVLLAVAGVADLLGGTGGPWCAPGSLLQGHALWHLGTAAAVALWAGVTVAARADRT